MVFSVWAVWQGKGRQVYRMPMLPCFHWKIQEKIGDMRAPPASRIMHYSYCGFATPAVKSSSTGLPEQSEMLNSVAVETLLKLLFFP
jgi:hypothetical protein